MTPTGVLFHLNYAHHILNYRLIYIPLLYKMLNNVAFSREVCHNLLVGRLPHSPALGASPHSQTWNSTHGDSKQYACSLWRCLSRGDNALLWSDPVYVVSLYL